MFKKLENLLFFDERVNNKSYTKGLALLSLIFFSIAIIIYFTFLIIFLFIIINKNFINIDVNQMNSLLGRALDLIEVLIFNVVGSYSLYQVREFRRVKNQEGGTNGTTSTNSEVDIQQVRRG